jgi:hypothetical protein
MKIAALAKQLSKDVHAVALPEGRKVGAPGHDKVRVYLGERLTAVGCMPFHGESFDLPYTHGGTHFTNVIGVTTGSNRALPALLIGAHYDSVINSCCADDNAAAVAIALAVAQWAAGRLERDLVIALFDAEEPPYFSTSAMGRNRFYADQLGDRQIHAALVMDLVGHDVSITGRMLEQMGGNEGIEPRASHLPLPELLPLVFMTGAESHPELPGIVTSIGHPAGLKIMPLRNQCIGDMSDHGAFRVHGVPYVFLSCGHWQHYHRVTDTPDRLNYSKMAHITRYTAALVEKLDAAALVRTWQVERTCDTLELERRMMQQALGDYFPLVLRAAGVAGIGTRADMERVVLLLLGLGL